MLQFFRKVWQRLWGRLRYCGAVHYLAGGPSLPPPLTPEQETALQRIAYIPGRARAHAQQQYTASRHSGHLVQSQLLAARQGKIPLLDRMAAGDAAAREELITHNLRLVVYLAKKYENSGVPAEDLVSIGTIGLIKAVNTFTPERSIKLATYASRCIGNEILMYLRKSSNRRQEASIDEPLNVDGDGNELLLSDILGSDENQISQRLEQDAERAVLRRAVDSLSPRERQIMELRFGLADGIERTQKEAADALGISQSYISRLEKRIIHTLKVQLENE
jgi:RNA polymerase sporulation-specific sigma factor